MINLIVRIKRSAQWWHATLNTAKAVTSYTFIHSLLMHWLRGLLRRGK